MPPENIFWKGESGNTYSLYFLILVLLRKEHQQVEQHFLLCLHRGKEFYERLPEGSILRI